MITQKGICAESQRLQDDSQRVHNWKRWGPYLSERQWATVREDYSADSNPWTYFTHEHAIMRSYRWGEDGLLGITDRQCRLCFGLALWNGKDRMLKERLFGLTGPEGNHGEDVKEEYFYLDATPTSSYLKSLYKYPMGRFPYTGLRDENRRRNLMQPEYELRDTALFDQNKYWDVFAEYAKASANEILIKITLANRSTEEATLHVLPTLWFRDTWTWGCDHEGCTVKPILYGAGERYVKSWHPTLGTYEFMYDLAPDGSTPPVYFTENESNWEKLFPNGQKNLSPYTKDAFHRLVINGVADAVNPRLRGTKVAPHYILTIPGGESREIRLCLRAEEDSHAEVFGKHFEAVFEQRIQEANDFYESLSPPQCTPEEKLIARQAYAGLLQSKQFYHYGVKEWLTGDPTSPAPPGERWHGRNVEWTHLFNREVISMPDKWEYPWYAAWDLAFHMIPMAQIDGAFAKKQLILMLREWYMHPNGQIPAYEFNFSDVNPPVHAWAAWRVYKLTGQRHKRDTQFLESVFQKLLINFTWWVNRKDTAGNNLFSGGFLGLDNIGVFDRSKPLPGGGYLQQADGTAWMAFYCLTMLAISLELAQYNPVYEDMASKFFEHFISISEAINKFGGTGLWDEEDGFYYDQYKVGNESIPMRLRSLVGLLPLIAIEVLEESKIKKLTGFTKRLEWFLTHRDPNGENKMFCRTGAHDTLRMLAIPSPKRLRRALRYMLDENEFLSPYGIRSVSKVYKNEPYIFRYGGEEHKVEYVPGESNSYMFGGNSNWRGPIWLPINYLLIEALERYHHFYDKMLVVECPTGSGNMMTLQQVAEEISRRLCRLFLPDENGIRPCHGGDLRFATDPNWKDLVLFHEYFHAETGKGLGASHQTGWTALVAKLLEDLRKTW
ncbi:glucosidase [Verrucomicrobia bacterium LW23]|nr:glucosidase [Verrucomicrobia bacterium LW23]